MLQCCGSPVAVPLRAGALFTVLPGLRGSGRLPVWLRSGSVPVQLRHRLDTKHAGTGVQMCVRYILSECLQMNWWCHFSQVFLPAAALLAWFSCTACCYAKLRFRRPYPLHRKLCQVVPMGVAYLLDISPLAHRLATRSWTSNSALPLHFLQVVFLIHFIHLVNLFTNTDQLVRLLTLK